ncbi:MAG TPA: peptide chain release factor N(5)-glutamine methyltransferase [Terriglobales bacterium]
MRLGEKLKTAIQQLTQDGVPSPRMNAELLMMFILDCDRAYLYGHPERELTPDEAARYSEALEKRSTGIPAQYITGHQEFWGMDFIVSPAVLIPRPETEHVIEEVLSRARSAEQAATRKLRIIDVGTGSGCIALSLAKELPDAEIHAVDISPAALEIARANAARNQLAQRVQFHEGDLLSGIHPESFDFVVSNPPYVGESEEEQVQLEVRKFEPRVAVFAGHSGLDIIQRLIPQAQEALRNGGWLVMEMSGTIAEQAWQLVADWNGVRIINDLQSIPRVLVAQKCPLVRQ